MHSWTIIRTSTCPQSGPSYPCQLVSPLVPPANATQTKRHMPSDASSSRDPWICAGCGECSCIKRLCLPPKFQFQVQGTRHEHKKKRSRNHQSCLTLHYGTTYSKQTNNNTNKQLQHWNVVCAMLLDSPRDISRNQLQRFLQVFVQVILQVWSICGSVDGATSFCRGCVDLFRLLCCHNCNIRLMLRHELKDTAQYSDKSLPLVREQTWRAGFLLYTLKFKFVL